MIIFYAFKVADGMAYLDSEESKHCLKVLRNKSGGIISFTDGKGMLYKGTIVSKDRKGMMLNKLEVVEKMAPSSKIVVAISPLKNPSRFEWFVEKAVEIGVTDIIPIICDRTEKKYIKSERINKIIRAAAKQSLSFQFPVLHEGIDFMTINMQFENQSFDKYIASFHSDNPHLLATKSLSENSLICIGPEGDFSDREIEYAKDSGFEKVNISNSRLRTETAGIVSVHLLSLKKESIK